MGRYQSDHIYEASGAFFVRYYVSAIVDGKATRVQRSYRVCSKDDKYHSRTCKAVKQKAAEQWTPRMRRCSGQRPDHCSLLGKDVPALRGGESPSRDRSRLQTNLGPAFEHALRHYSVEGLQTHMGSLFLTSLAKKLGRATIQQIRSLASGIFAHAVNVAVIESNPWHDVKVL